MWGYQAENYDEGKQVYHFASPETEKFKCFDRSGAFSKLECTTQQPLCDLPSGWFHPAICALGGKCRIRGHMNWPMAATYEGILSWDQQAEDQDYDFFLYPPKQAGLTTASCLRRKKAFGIEFDSRETIQRIKTDDKEFWWTKFRDAVAMSDQQFLDELRKGKFAIITGLINLDCEHECTAELHPVWVMAIHLKDDPSDDRWALLARNWGNEGFCSSSQHYLDLQSKPFIVRLPWRNQAASVAVNTSASKFWMSSPQMKQPEVAYRPNEAAFVKFTLPETKSEDRPFVVVDLHLQWKDGQPEPVHPIAPIDSNCEIAALAAPVPSAEERITAIRKLLKQDESKLKRYNARLAMQTQERVSTTSCRPIEAATAEPTALAPSREPPRVRSEFSGQKAKEDDLEGEALCDAFNNNLPGLPDVCKKRKRR